MTNTTHFVKERSDLLFSLRTIPNSLREPMEKYEMLRDQRDNIVNELEGYNEDQEDAKSIALYEFQLEIEDMMSILRPFYDVYKYQADQADTWLEELESKL